MQGIPESKLVFALKRQCSVLEHHLKQLEAMVLAQNNEMEVLVAVGCAFTFELGREIARIEDDLMKKAEVCTVGAAALVMDTYNQLRAVDTGISEAEIEAAIKERYAAQDEALKKMEATRAEQKPLILKPT